MNFNLINKELKRVEEEIYKAIPTEPKEVFGMLPEYISRGGKRIRPILTIGFSKMLGGNVEEGISYGAGIEMFHNFTLIHDDIEDDSKIRRGKPTLHITYGLPIAINAGDALYTLVWRYLSDMKIAAEKKERVLSLFSEYFLKVVEGQGLELSWYLNNKYDITEEEYFKMVEGKTASLISLACILGGMTLEKEDRRLTEKLKKFGKAIGIAFQIQDDILNIIGEEEKYKKEIGGDLEEGKRTLMVVDFLKKAKEKEKKFFLENLGKKLDKEIKKRMIDLLASYGSVDYAKKVAKKHMEEGLEILEEIEGRDEEIKKFLKELSLFIIKREL